MEPRRLSYALRFYRPPKTAEHPDAPATARSVTIADGGVQASMTPEPGAEALLETNYALNGDQTMFFEWGKIDFGPLGAPDRDRSGLTFGSIGAGTLLGPPGPDGFSHGVVLWRVTGGSGSLEGAKGAIASNTRGCRPGLPRRPRRDWRPPQPRSAADAVAQHEGASRDGLLELDDQQQENRADRRRCDEDPTPH